MQKLNFSSPSSSSSSSSAHFQRTGGSNSSSSNSSTLQLPGLMGSLALGTGSGNGLESHAIQQIPAQPANATPTPPIIRAVTEGNLDDVNTLIEQGVNVNETDADGKTALMHAAESNHNLEIIKALINANADVHVQDEEGKTALMHALVNNSDIEVIKAIIEERAAINASDNNNKTVSMYAAENIDFDPKDASADDPSEWYSLFINLIDGESLDNKDEDGKTTLMYAAEKGNAGPVKTLLWTWEEMNGKFLTDNNQRTALHYAAQGKSKGHKEAAIWLCIATRLEGPIDINAKDINGETALMLAVRATSFLMVDTLRNMKERASSTCPKKNNGAKNASVRCKNNEQDKKTALDIAKNLPQTDPSNYEKDVFPWLPPIDPRAKIIRILQPKTTHN